MNLNFYGRILEENLETFIVKHSAGTALVYNPQTSGYGLYILQCFCHHDNKFNLPTMSSGG